MYREQFLPPVALFAYNRPDHLKLVIESLLLNVEAPFTDVYLFVDRINNPAEFYLTEQIIKNCEPLNGFKSLSIMLRSNNIGLKENIIRGINYVLTLHDSVIVLEDDVVVCTSFLRFMSTLLNLYRHDDRVWHVSAYNGMNICDSTIVENEPLLSKHMNCWGWATWAERWKKLELDPVKLLKRMTFRDRMILSYYGTAPFYSHLVANYLGLRKTWAIYWYATIIANNGMVVMPLKSLTSNIGFDGSGTHKADLLSSDIVNTSPPYFSNSQLRNNIDHCFRLWFSERYSPDVRIKSFLIMFAPLFILRILRYFRFTQSF